MDRERSFHVIARIHTDFPTKFGIPRQSGLIEDLKAEIIFEPEYRNADALRGIEEFSHLWLIWEFSESVREGWSPMVRPPRLGGNKRVGVFATRSPFRPNPIGLSSVRLNSVELHKEKGPVLHVSGADMMDGYTKRTKEYALQVEIAQELLEQMEAEKREALKAILANDPRPSYQNDPDRVYGLEFAGHEIRFTVRNGVLTVTEIQ